jgi:predicted DsbA family dithiol-disulfide isomerase
VRLAYLMALACGRVRAEAIDATEFRALASLYGVRGVPRIVFNRRVHVEGAVPEPVFLQNLLAAAAPAG